MKRHDNILFLCSLQKMKKILKLLWLLLIMLNSRILGLIWRGKTYFLVNDTIHRGLENGKYQSSFSPTWLLPWRRLLCAMLVPKQTRSIERSQWERKLKLFFCVVLYCASRSDWDKLVGFYRIPSVASATSRIWGRTDDQSGEKNKKIKAICGGDTELKDVFNSERVFGKHFVSGSQLGLAGISTTNRLGSHIATC